CLVYVRTPLGTKSELPWTMKPRERSLHDPTVPTQPASVECAATCNLRINSSASKPIAMRLRVVSPVGVHPIGLPSRTPRLASDRRDRVHQGFQLSDVRGVGAGQRSRQRDASAVGDHVVFTPRFRAIRRVWTSLLTPAQGAHRRTVDSRTRPVDPIGGIQFGQQKLVQSLPDTSLVPVAQSPPASHTAATAHLLGQVFPLDAGLEVAVHRCCCGYPRHSQGKEPCAKSRKRLLWRLITVIPLTARLNGFGRESAAM